MGRCGICLALLFPFARFSVLGVGYQDPESTANAQRRPTTVRRRDGKSYDCCGNQAEDMNEDEVPERPPKQRSTRPRIRCDHRMTLATCFERRRSGGDGRSECGLRGRPGGGARDATCEL